LPAVAAIRVGPATYGVFGPSHRTQSISKSTVVPAGHAKTKSASARPELCHLAHKLCRGGFTSRKAGWSNDTEVSDLVTGGVSKSSELFDQVKFTVTGVPAVATGPHIHTLRSRVREERY